MDIALALSRRSPSHEVFAQAIKDHDTDAIAKMLPLVWNDYLKRYFVDLCADGYTDAVRLFLAEWTRRGNPDIITSFERSIGLMTVCISGDRDLIGLFTQPVIADLNMGLKGAFLCSRPNRDEIIDLMFQLGADSCQYAMTDAWKKKDLDRCHLIFTTAKKQNHGPESVDIFFEQEIVDWELKDDGIWYIKAEQETPDSFDSLMKVYYPDYSRPVDDINDKSDKVVEL